MAFGASGLVADTPGAVSAVDSSASVGAFVPLTPCRLIDTRPDSTVGVNPGTIDGGDTFVFQVRGAADPCPSTIPADAVALTANVTAVGPTAPTFLTLWGDGSRPPTSNLNPVPGQPPTPNAVDIPLGAAGDFRIFNRAGSVDVIVDVMGYVVEHDHADRYYSKAEADGRFAGAADVYTRSQADNRFAVGNDVYGRSETYSRSEIDDRSPTSSRISSQSDCRADGTAVGEVNAGQWETCLSLRFNTTGTLHIQVHVDFGYHVIGQAAGECRFVIAGTPDDPLEYREMGQVDVTDPSHLARGAMNWAGLETIAAETDTVEFQCLERSGDIDWTDVHMSMTLMKIG